MKNYLLFALLLAVGCAPKSKEEVKLVVSTETLAFESGEAAKVFHIQSNAQVSVSSTETWCTVSFNQEQVSSTFPVSVAVSAHLDSTAGRHAQIQIAAGNLTATVQVSQQKAPSSLPADTTQEEEEPPLPDSITADKTDMASDAALLPASMQIGWNLGNTLEACNGTTSAGETSWGNPLTTQRLIDSVKAAGFNTVRIPCAWSGYIENQTTFKIKSSWLRRVKEVVDYCINNDMYAIVNIHWDGGWLEEHPLYAKQAEVNQKQQALWKQIAVYFRDYDEHLLFAGTNEVHDGYGNPTPEHIAVQLSYNQTFVDAVRATGGRNAWRNLLVQAYNTNIDHAVNHFSPPTDRVANRLMLEVHYYDPYDFTLDDKSSVYLWGKDFSGAGAASWGKEAHVDTQLGRLKTEFIDKGIPVVIGEYCATLRSSLAGIALQNHIQARNYYLEYVTGKATQNGIVPVYWDNGVTGNNGSGLFNRANGAQVHRDAIRAIVSH
ncbi:hypothetical protein AGMMS4956_10430 [Bacteroidia bacterium]|nr:hypothetical protein AGMMS4956_10430 [Bacteroidia bacterium]